MEAAGLHQESRQASIASAPAIAHIAEGNRGFVAGQREVLTCKFLLTR